jgi:pimeloyl-ACP methyl ester carboxylesterase
MAPTISNRNSRLRQRLRLLLAVATGYFTGQQIWILSRLFLIRDTPRRLATHQNRNTSGLTFSKQAETASYQVNHTIEHGIERIVYRPNQPRFRTPLLMLHGMFHSAWCWESWQRMLAGLGWESHAFSLPGHGLSPEQKPVRLCTLDYYLGFVKAEAARLPTKPVLIGHSMGGALAQWYLKHVGDDLPAAILVAPWTSHSVLADGLPRFLRLDPTLLARVILDWSATPFIRTPELAGRGFLAPNSIVSPTELHGRLYPESLLVLYQHNPPFWRPPTQVATPMLWLAGAWDALFSVESQLRSAVHYQAYFAVIQEAGHNLMMAHNYQETAWAIHEWLVEQEIL